VEVALRGVWHSYDGRTRALRGVELVFAGPGIYAVLGPNGAGKTTLLKIASLILKPSGGSVLVDGVDFWDLSEGERDVIRRRVAYVHDKPILLRGSARENAALGMRMRGEVDEALLEHYMRRYGLTDVEGLPASRLSAGQAKAVTLVRALTVRPKLLALDEPFAFLDGSRARTLVEDIARIAEGGGTVLVATHYMYRELRDVVSYVVEIVSGEVRSVAKLR
jgi:ABC-type multidrug transport system ATPase subunit